LEATITDCQNNTSGKGKDNTEDEFRGLFLSKEEIGKESHKNGVCGNKDYTACHRGKFQGAYPKGKMERQEETA